MRRRLIILAAVLAGLAATLPAMADTAQPRTVSANPVDNTPHILDGTVRDIAVVGGTVVVGGDFTQVTDSSRRNTYRRNYLFAYDLGSGRVLDFAPALDGPVLALSPGAGGTVYAGGSFRQVGGVAQRGLTQLRVDTGARVATFAAAINYGEVRSLVARGPWVYAGGTFTAVNGAPRTALARLSATTGAVDAGFDMKLAAPRHGGAKLQDLAVSPDGSRVVAAGAIEQASGQYRAQLAVIDTAASPARLADWWTTAYDAECWYGFDTYLRGVDFSPDGSYFVVVTTGKMSDPKLACDTAARFNVAGTGAHSPVWVNHTGGYSLYAVSVTGPAVYVGGHQLYQDNPYGHKSAGPGAVSRIGIAALNPVTGKALPWNPTRTRGAGVRAFAATPAGLIVGSDTEELGHEYHGRIGMFPLG
ncbi:delta-60 repeat domain-containing protein [Planosporangium mesophilum]|uniref:PKD domain containing protein n=1 Tax=Planosporangium mesophilum TaxID=689768 RepID=A0A8J3TH89_9ACTN|nr:delta-60 repeat domain-containing protein [Planosporangium mesophilum]NJC86039.1 delta-60 repeat domain-containing protein [Planosporangium mesophilum]GII25546.1 hypothetical protein Pme01_51430 [Planosporangium mesophilum]